MPSVDFDAVAKFIKLPDDARILLERPERELRITMSLRLDAELLQTDVFVVYYNTARGPAKGGIRFWPTELFMPLYQTPTIWVPGWMNRF